jgi:hypothetical protein
MRLKLYEVLRKFITLLNVSKIKKTIRRWWRVTLWFVAVAVSWHNIQLATHDALHTKITQTDRSRINRLKLCVEDASAEVGAIIGKGTSATKVGIAAFFRYFIDHWWAGIVLLVALGETITHFSRGRRAYRRWRLARKRDRARAEAEQ